MKKYYLTAICFFLLFTLSLTGISYATPEIKADSKNILKHSEDPQDLQKKYRTFHKNVLSKKKISDWTEDEKKEFLKLEEDVKILVEEINNPKSNLFGPAKAEAYDTKPSDVEMMLDLNNDNLSLSDLLAGYSTSKDALADANAYAVKNGLTSVTDNIADAYRHFIWNYKLAKKTTAAKAKIMTDNHELADIGAKLSNKDSSIPSDMKTAGAVAIIEAIEPLMKSSSYYFIYYIDTDTSKYMDFSNNGAGRFYRNVADQDSAFSLALQYGDVCKNLSDIATYNFGNKAYLYFKG